MPQTATQEEQAAHGLLFDQVHVPVFLQKLAAYGVEPQSREELQALLDMGQTLMQSHQADQEKKAAARGSFILGARDSLHDALGARPAADDRSIKAAAYRVASDPAARQAALTYQAYLQRQGA